MADEPTAAAGGAAAPAGEPAYKSELAAMLAAEKAELDAAAETPPAEKKPTEAKKEEELEEDGSLAEAREKEALEDGEDDPGENEEPGDDEEPDGKSKYSKALRKLQKDEASLQQFKTQVLAKEKAVGEREQRATTAERELGDFLAEIRRNPVETLLKSGLISEEEVGYWAKQFTFLSPEALKDPRSRPEAERLRRERERERESKRVASEVEKMRRERDDERAKAEQDAVTTAYVGKLGAVAKAYKAKHPVLAQALEKDPDGTDEELRAVAHRLSVAKQALEDPGLVVLAWVKQRKKLLAAHGIVEAAAPTTNKAKSQKPAEQKGATDAASKTAAAAPPTDDENKPGTPAYQRKLRAMLSDDV